MTVLCLSSAGLNSETNIRTREAEVTDDRACVCTYSIVLHFQSHCASDNSKTDEVHLLQVWQPPGTIRNCPGRGRDSGAVKKSDVFSSCLTLKFKVWGKSLQK